MTKETPALTLYVAVAAVVVTVFIAWSSSLWFISGEFSSIKAEQKAWGERSMLRYNKLTDLESAQLQNMREISNLSMLVGIVVVRVENLENQRQRIVYRGHDGVEKTVIRPLIAQEEMP